jgi:CPA1 family monovalent cation:H+ antiporter
VLRPGARRSPSLNRVDVPSISTIAVVVVLLAVAFLFARVLQSAGLPVPAAVLLVGIAAGGMLPVDLRIALTPATLAIFLPALIFEAAWSLDADTLRRTAGAIVVLAVPGVFFTAAAIACAAAGAGGMSLAAAFALGAILSATDPVAVIALFRSLKVPPDLLAIVEGESIANDGVAAVLVASALAFVSGATNPALLAWRALYAVGAGVAIGIAVAAIGAPVLRRFRAPAVGIAVTLAVAYGGYVLATVAGASGIFASAAAGVALPRLALDKSEVRTIERFWDGTAFLANAAVFLLVGLSLRLERIFAEPLLLLAVIASVIASRAVLAYVFVPLVRGRDETRGWQHAVALAGVRGGLSLALALGLPREFPNRPAIIDAVFAVVFLTVVVQGWTLAPLLRRIDLRPKVAA